MRDISSLTDQKGVKKSEKSRGEENHKGTLRDQGDKLCKEENSEETKTKVKDAAGKTLE